MERKQEEMIIKLQALLRGWLVRRHHRQQKAAIIRFQAGNIIPFSICIYILTLCKQQFVVFLLVASLQQKNVLKKKYYNR